MSKRRWLAAGILSVLLALCVGLAAGNAAAAAAAGSWSGDTWQTSEEEGVITYTMSDAGRLTYDGTVDFNYLEADVKMSDALQTSQFLFALHTGNDTSTNAYFRYYPEPTWQSVRIYYGVWDNTGDDYEYNTGADGLIFTDTWRKFAFVFENDYLAMYVDGELIAKATGDYSATDFTKVTPLFYAWGVNVQIKNIVTKTVVPEDLEQAQPEPSAPWEPGSTSWSEKTENGETVYTCTFDGGRLYNRQEVTGNTLSLDVMLTDITEASNTCNFAFAIDGGAEESYLITYYPYHGQFVIQSGPVFNDWTTTLKKNGIGDVPYDGGWVNMKFVFSAQCLAAYVDDEPVLWAFGNFETDFAAAQIFLYSWGHSASVKNLAFTETDIADLEELDLDLEFSTPRSISRFTAEGAMLSHTEGQMKATVTDSNATITLAELKEPAGDKNSAYLPVMNTIVLRMKNNTMAEQLKVEFITSESSTFDAEKTLTFDVEPDSEYRTYYLNLSASKGCKGYLRGFKFTLLGAVSGDVYIDAITFEREDPYYAYAGEIVSAVADKDTRVVTVTGTVDKQYNGKTVTLYESYITNYTDSLDYVYHDQSGKDNPMPVLGKAMVTDGAFTITFDLDKADGMTHLSSRLLAGVEGVKVAKSFAIENYYDFSENPYAFTLPDLTVSVTDAQFGAKGDGFTNDTAAIQAAIDYVNSRGGGTVVLTGDDSAYGRRYVATNIKMKSNVELRIEEGAVLLQSSRAEDYDYEVIYGHDKDIEGIVWCHVGVVLNYPLIQLNSCENVKVTGGGTIRLMTAGSEQADGYNYEWSTDVTLMNGPTDRNITTGCANTIHIQPITVDKCKNVEIRDLTILRNNIWNISVRFSENVYLGNVNVQEAECINADGFGLTATKNAVIDRCFAYTNDDAITLGVQYNDPRGHVWWESQPGEDNCLENVLITHNNLWGGLGIAFVPWGTADPDLGRQEMREIVITDNILGGTSRAIGSWRDNPYYGWSSFYDYNLDNGEADDFSPIRDVRIYNNVYRADYTQTGSAEMICNIGSVRITNLYTDCGIHSSDQILNPSFERDFRYATETQFVSGLTNWSREIGENGEAGYEERGTKMKTPKYNADGSAYSGGALEVKDYAAFIKGNGELYQGLYKTFGAYVFGMDVKLLSGQATLFVRDSLTGEEIVSQSVAASDTFTTVSVKFTLDESREIQLGIRHEGGAEEIVYLDDATLTTDASAGIYDVEGEEIVQDFDDGEYDFTVKPGTAGITAEDGVLVTAATSEYKLLLNNGGALDTFEVSVDILNADGMVNAGLYLFAGNAGAGQDDIAAYNVQVEKALDAGSYTVSLFLFENAYIGSLAKSGSILLEGDIIHLRVVVKANTIFVFTDGGEEPVLTYEVPAGTSGNVGLRSQMAETTFDNFRLKTEQYVQSGGDKSALFELIRQSNRFSEYGYTAETYAAFREAVEAARALPDDAKQSEIDDCYERLERAMGSLRPRDVTAEERQTLEDLVAVAEKFVPDDYTAESYGELIQALTAAQAALESGADYVSAKTALQAAIEELETQPTANVGETPDQGGSGWVLPVVLCLAGLAVGAGGALGISALMRRKKR